MRRGALPVGLPLVLALGTALAAAPGAAATPVPAGAGVPRQVEQRSCEDDGGQWVPAAPAALARLGAARAWELATGAGVTVAVVDSGVDARNDHLDGALAPGVDLVDATGDGTTDAHGHGTAVAGIVAARPVEGSGVVGLAPDATVLPVRVYADPDGEDGLGVDAARTAEGIRAAVNRGARVVNVSLSFPADHPELREAVAAATAQGALVVASAGNLSTLGEDDDPTAPRYPAAYPEVLAVAAVDAADQVADTVVGGHVDVAAPGTEVLTAFRGHGDCLLGGAASTSWATAYVSAAAALLVERYPAETPAQWAHRLEVTAARPDPARRTDDAGWGVIRPYLALAFVDDGAAPGPPSPVHEAPPPVEVAPPSVELGVREDPTARARAATTWWLLGGAAAAVAALVVAQLAPRRRRAR